MTTQRAPLVLVVDGDPGTSQLERLILENAGFRVEVVQDGESAIARAREVTPDLVVMEILLPGMDGLTVCRQLRSEHKTKDVPILVLTALMVRQRCMDAGANAFLLKPIDEKRLVATARELIERRGPRVVDTIHRITTGNDALDRVTGGGIPAESINLIAGMPGTGKTILAQQVVFANASDEMPAVYLTTLWEPLEKAIRYLQRFSFFDPDRMASCIKYLDVSERILQDGASCMPHIILDLIRSNSPRIVVIDSFKALRGFSTSGTEFRRLMYRLSQILSAYSCTAFWIGDYTEASIEIYPEFAAADGIIFLENRNIGDRDQRRLRVMKLRGSDYIPGEHPFRITARGLEIRGDNAGPGISDSVAGGGESSDALAEAVS
ncbi:MAG TPA: response regulator [Firmicutes bacterium]|nr:response regulator [Bacillota bacterium]